MNIETSIETSGYGDLLCKDLDIGKKILDVLEHYYPLHAWFVNVSNESGHCTIQLMYPGVDDKLRIWRYGMLLHLNKLGVGQELEAKIMRTGGEVLERYNMSRGKLTANDYAEFLKNGVDTAGMVN